MAEQYVTNNVSLVATADAIRAKTGNTSGIEWNNSTGFASAIEAISGEAQILTGSFTAGSVTKLREGGYMLQGIDFVAKKIIVYRTDYQLDLSSLTPGFAFVFFAELGELRTDIPNVNDIYSCHTLTYTGYSGGGGYISSANKISMYPTTDSYLLMQWFDDPGTDLYMAPGTYNWIAVG